MLRAASVVAIVAEKYDGQRIFVAADSAALGNAAVVTPRAAAVISRVYMRDMLSL